MAPVLQPIGGAVIAALKQINAQLGLDFAACFSKNYEQNDRVKTKGNWITIYSIA